MSVSNTGPWVLTPTGDGTVEVSFIVMDSRGGRVIRTATYTVQANVPPVVSGTVELGFVPIGTSFVVTNAQLVALTTDADLDSLTVKPGTISVAQGTVSGSGPWTITPTVVTGSNSLTYIVQDGKGGEVEAFANFTVRYDLVTKPASIASWFTWDIYSNNTTTYHPDLIRASLGTGKTYYVDPVNGNNANDGLSWATALASPSTAANKSDAVWVALKGGVRYPKAFFGDTSFGTQFKGMYCDDDEPALFLASNLDDSGSFVADATNPGTYKWTGFSGTLYGIYDENILDEHKSWSRLFSATSAADCATRPGTYYKGATDLWVNLADGRAPDNKLRINTQRRTYVGKSNLALYWKGISWLGGSVVPNPLGSNIVNHFYKCEFAYASSSDDACMLSVGSVAGMMTFCHTCKAHKGQLDAFSAQGGAKVALINCEGYNLQMSGSNNAATSHGSANLVIINGFMHDTQGRVIASVSTGDTLLVGVISRNCPGTAGSDFNATSGPMYMVNCANPDSVSDYSCDGGAVKYIKNCNLTKPSISGILTPTELYQGLGVMPSVDSWITNNNPVAPTLDLGTLDVGIGLVVSTNDLLAGATDIDGDTLSIASVVAVSGGTITGSGPYTITPTSEGSGSVNVTIVDGEGGSVVRSVTWVGVQSTGGVTYSRLLDYQGIYRPTIPSVGTYITVPAFTYDPAVDTVEFEVGAQCYSNNPYDTTVEENTLTRDLSNTFRAKLVRSITGEVKINSMANSTLITLGPADTWPLNEAVRFKLELSPSTLSLYKMDNAGVYQFVNSVARGTFTTFSAFRLLGNGRGFHGTIFYYAAKKNGVTQFDFNFDEMTFINSTMKSAHDASVVATLVGSNFSWKDETPESLAPQPDISVSGTLSHGSTLTITSPTLTFDGGLPEQYIYDDMVGKSGAVQLAATIGSFNSFGASNANATYKTGGPNGRPYIVRRDEQAGERLARTFIPTNPFKEVFVSRLLRVPTGYAWPGATDGSGETWPRPNAIPSDSTWKDIWVLYADDAGATGSDLCMGTHSGAYNWQQSGNTPHQEGGQLATGRFDLREVHALGEWNHVDNYAKHNDASPNNGYHVQHYCSSLGKNAEVVSQSSVLAGMHGYNLFQIAIDGAYVQANSLCRVEAAEIYIATGPNAACRAVLGNSVRWEQCTKKGTCPPLTWSSNTITVRCGTGTLNTSTDPLYLFVIGPNGQPIYPYGKKLN